MDITLRFFASVREALGVSQEAAIIPPDVTTVGEVRTHLAGRGGAWAQALAPDRSLRMAYNQVMCGPETAVTQGCEVAFFPPVTGG
jgi:molybdopterin synthase sulfur carrier subunit